MSTVRKIGSCYMLWKSHSVVWKREITVWCPLTGQIGNFFEISSLPPLEKQGVCMLRDSFHLHIIYYLLMLIWLQHLIGMLIYETTKWKFASRDIVPFLVSWYCWKECYDQASFPEPFTWYKGRHMSSRTCHREKEVLRDGRSPAHHVYYEYGHAQVDLFKRWVMFESWVFLYDLCLSMPSVGSN